MNLLIKSLGKGPWGGGKQSKYMKAFYQILKPGGIHSLYDQAGDPDKMMKDDLKE